VQRQTVAALMGEMGRAYDGGYAEYTLVPARQVISLDTHLSWETLAAIPETFLTAWGSLDAMGIESGQTLYSKMRVYITLLVFSLQVPTLDSPYTSEHLVRMLLMHWPSYLAFFISFATILIMWISHQRISVGPFRSLLIEPDRRQGILHLGVGIYTAGSTF